MSTINTELRLRIFFKRKGLYLSCKAKMQIQKFLKNHPKTMFLMAKTLKVIMKKLLTTTKKLLKVKEMTITNSITADLS